MTEENVNTRAGKFMAATMAKSQDDYMADLMAHLDHTDDLAVPHKLVAGCRFCADYAEERRPMARFRAWVSARMVRIHLGPCGE